MKSSLPLFQLNKEEYKPLKNSVAFADFETDGLGGDFIAGGMVGMNDNEVIMFRSISEFFDLALEEKTKGKELVKVYSSIYFHNLEYDGRYIVDELIKRKISCEFINRCQRLMIIKVGKFSFVDSYALLMDSLDNLSRVFASDYQKKQLDLNKVVFNPDNPQHIEYLTFDCLALKHIVIRCRKVIYDTFGINAKFTTSSTALRAWQTTLQHTLFRLSDDKDEYVRKAYSGGLVYHPKTELYENIHVFDFNSMYPSVMRDNKYPHGSSYYVTKFKGQGFYHCYVDSKHAQFLFINGYDEHGKKHARMNGKFEAWITDIEYQLGLKIGYNFLIIDGLVFEESDYLFKDFVDMCEGLRLQHGKDSIGTIVKYIQNSLYGKFGTKKTREQISYYGSDELIEDKTPFIDPITGDFNGLYVDLVDTDEPYMLPHLAAYTTALARCKLVEAVLSAGIENVVYGDTDSLFVNDVGAFNLSFLLGETYGKIKLENTFKRVLIVAPKLYFGDNKKRAKGFPKHVIAELENMLMNNQLEIVDGQKELRVVAQFVSLNSVRNILKNGKAFNKPMHRSIPKLPDEVYRKVKGLS